MQQCRVHRYRLCRRRGVVEHGVFTLELRGSSFVAHSVLSGDLEGEDAPYRFEVTR